MEASRSKYALDGFSIFTSLTSGRTEPVSVSCAVNTIIEFDVSKLAEVNLKISSAQAFWTNVNKVITNKVNIINNFFIYQSRSLLLYNGQEKLSNCNNLYIYNIVFNSYVNSISSVFGIQFPNNGTDMSLNRMCAYKNNFTDLPISVTQC